MFRVRVGVVCVCVWWGETGGIVQCHLEVSRCRVGAGHILKLHISSHEKNLLLVHVFLYHSSTMRPETTHALTASQ